MGKCSTACGGAAARMMAVRLIPLFSEDKLRLLTVRGRGRLFCAVAGRHNCPLVCLPLDPRTFTTRPRAESEHRWHSSRVITAPKTLPRFYFSRLRFTKHELSMHLPLLRL
jgi:hypothetical protein